MPGHPTATTTTLAASVLLALAACTNQQSEVRTGYEILEIPASPPADTHTFYAALKGGLEASGATFSVAIDPLPDPLPDQPGRFTTINPLKNTSLGALIGNQAAAWKTASCDGASFVANLSNGSMNRFGENTRFVACVFPHRGGYAVNIWHIFSLSNASLGATLARGVIGDSSQFIPRTLDSIASSLRSAGFTPKIVDAST